MKKAWWNKGVCGVKNRIEFIKSSAGRKVRTVECLNK